MTTKAPIGKVFGRLTVLSEPFRPEGRTRNYVYCECSCGTIGPKAIADLCSGSTSSCGCYAREQSSKRESSHRMSNTPEYNVWKGIKQRCTNPNHTHYGLYGGRGIEMCPEWLESFEQFLADMGPRPEGMTIDRIDGNRGYHPDNCRWATKKEQSRNIKTNVLVEYDGRSMTIKELSERAVVDYATLCWRLGRGWEVERAVTTPSKNPNNRVNRREPT